MADYVNFGPIIASVNAVNSNVMQLNRLMRHLESELQFTKETLNREINNVKTQIAMFRHEQKMAGSLQRALTEIVRVRQELESKFGTQKQVREYMLGILQASDLGLITKTTISKCTEELMISAPKYWLAPCLIALAAWISNNKSLANRALKEALKRDEEKTCLLFALITRRVNAGRVSSGKEPTNISFIWLSRYFSLLNPFKMRTSIISYIDAYANGIFGIDKDNICREHIDNWLRRLEKNDPDFAKEQKKYWLRVFNSKCPDYAMVDEYRALQKISPEYPRIVDYVSKLYAIDGQNGVRNYFVDIMDERVDKEKLINDIDKQLMNLVTNYEEDEAELREEEQYLNLVKEYNGDEDKARNSVHFLKSLRKDEPVNFAKRLSDSILDKSVSLSAKKTAISLMSPYIEEAYIDFVNQDKDAYPEKINLVIEQKLCLDSGVEPYKWEGETINGENREELISSYKKQLEELRDKTVNAISDEKALKNRKTGIILTCTILFAIIPVGPIMWYKAHKELKQNAFRRQTIMKAYNDIIASDIADINNALDARINANQTVEAFNNGAHKDSLINR